MGCYVVYTFKFMVGHFIYTQKDTEEGVEELHFFFNKQDCDGHSYIFK